MREITVGGQIGRIQISNEVLALISGTAALEVEGVVGHMVNEAPSRTRFAKRNFGRGVKITVAQEKVTVDISIFVKFGYKIHAISEEVQKRIKLALETMVGMKVKEVNVNVVGIQFEKAAKPKQKTRRK